MKPVLAVLAFAVAGTLAAPVPIHRFLPTTDLDERQIFGGDPPYWKREAEPLPADMGDEKRQVEGYWRDDTRIYWKRDWPTGGGWWFPGPVFWKRTADASATPDPQSRNWGGNAPYWKRHAHDSAAPDPRSGTWGDAPPHWKRNPDADVGPTSGSDLEARQCGGIWGGGGICWKRDPEAEGGPTSDVASRQTGVWDGAPVYWKREPEAINTATSS